jgi:hypothetical protein
MKLASPIAATLLLIATIAVASPQEARIRTEGLDHLAETAATSIDINLDDRALRTFRNLVPCRSSIDCRHLMAAISGVTGIYVRKYEFETEGGYTEADVSVIRDQMALPRWTKLFALQTARARQEIEVYSASAHGRVLGVSLIDIKPKSLTVVNMVGPVDLAKVADLVEVFRE